MVSDDIRVFIDELAYQDHYVVYCGQKLFFNGCQCETDDNGKVKSSHIEVYNLDTKEVIFSYAGKNQSECIDAMLDNFSIGGKSFYEAALDMEWIDG